GPWRPGPHQRIKKRSPPGHGGDAGRGPTRPHSSKTDRRDHPLNIRHHRRPGRHARPALTLDADNGGGAPPHPPPPPPPGRAPRPGWDGGTPPAGGGSVIVWYSTPPDDPDDEPDYPDEAGQPGDEPPPEGAEPLFEATVADLWPGLPGLRCTRDAAPHPTPIP